MCVYVWCVCDIMCVCAPPEEPALLKEKDDMCEAFDCADSASSCEYIYIYIYMCMYICTYIYTRMRKVICARSLTVPMSHPPVSIYIYINIYICTCTHIHMIYIYVYVYIYI